jgi:Trk K+ transport system NAD-binding subunit
MGTRRRRVLYYVSAFAALIVAYTLVYTWGMGTFEGQPRTVTEGLLAVVQSLTTTGYGEDAANWTSPAMVGFMLLVQFTGVFFIFMALPLFVVPWLEDRLSTSVPTSVSNVSDHVVICTFTDRSRSLIQELAVEAVDYVVIEPDRSRARNLVEDGVTVIVGDPTTDDALQRANLPAARALVADAGEETNASITLGVDSLAPEVEVITFVEDPEEAGYHRYAGADTVFSPRHLIGESLATRVTMRADDALADAVAITDDFEITELPVQAGSSLDGVRIADSQIRERTGAHILGGWFRGEFVAPPDPDAVIDGRTTLLVAGREAQLEALSALTPSERRRGGGGPVLLCGYGEVGQTVAATLEAAGTEFVTIDDDPELDVDVLGDVTEPDTFERAGLADTSTVILAVGKDRTAVFATLVVRQLTDEADVIARANSTDSVRKLYQAGADYVLALSTVSGRMLASTILGEDVLTYDHQIEVVRVPAGAFSGATLGELDLRARTASTVIAVERDGEVITEFGPEFAFEADDELIVAGPDRGVADLRAMTRA